MVHEGKKLKSHEWIALFRRKDSLEVAVSLLEFWWNSH